MKKVVYVEWDDSASSAGSIWKNKETVANFNTCRCKTIGFVIKETKDTLTIVSSSDGGDYVSGDMSIPKSAIRKRRIVRWKK